MEGTGEGQGNKRRRLSARTWRELLTRFDAAGVTVEAFCQGEGLSRSSFNRWRSRLQARPGGVMLGPPTGGDRASSSSPFVDLGPLSVTDAMVPTALTAPVTLDLRLELGGGIVLHLQRR